MIRVWVEAFEGKDLFRAFTLQASLDTGHYIGWVKYQANMCQKRKIFTRIIFEFFSSIFFLVNILLVREVETTSQFIGTPCYMWQLSGHCYKLPYISTWRCDFIVTAVGPYYLLYTHDSYSYRPLFMACITCTRKSFYDKIMEGKNEL